MRRVIRQVGVATAARPIAAPGLTQDPAVLALVEAERARAYQQGVADGEARGRAEAEATGSALAASIAQALQVARTSSERVADELAGRCNQIAVAAAAAVVGQVDAEAGGVLHRVRQALTVVDERPVTVEVHQGDVDLVQAVGGPEVTVVAAADLRPGEARIGGRWASADLTWQAVWNSVREALDVD